MGGLGGNWQRLSESFSACFGVSQCFDGGSWHFCKSRARVFLAFLKIVGLGELCQNATDWQ